MASIKSQTFNEPGFMAGDGRASVNIGRALLTANPAVNDTIDFRIPAGVEVAEVKIQCDDLDSNGTPTIAFGVGYAPIKADSQYTANATYFAAAGQTTARTGGRLDCAFVPIKFNEDMMLRLTVGAASATFQAGSIYAIVIGASRGVN